METVHWEIDSVRQPIREVLHLGVDHKNLRLLPFSFARQDFYVFDVKVFILRSHLVC
jgi:hypothetical protein